MMKKVLVYICVTGLTLVSSSWAAPKSTQIELNTKNIQIKYDINDGRLALKQASFNKWLSPIGDPVFPGNPHRGGNSPRYQGAIETIVANGDTALEPMYQSHHSQKEASGAEHLTIFLRDSVYPIEIELHLRAYADVDVFEQWMVVKNGMDQPLRVRRMDSISVSVPGK